MRVLLVQPPRACWPFVSEGDNYLLPQALPALAATVREAGIEVRVLDCMPLRMGWRSLAVAVEEYAPQVVAAGENHALYAHEVLKFFRMCREVCPQAFRVVGGAHFTHLWRRYLGVEPDTGDDRALIDAAVLGEGEITFRELCLELARDDPDLRRVQGIAFSEGERAVLNPPRPLVEDLDTLPLPAYDLVPMHRYGTSRWLFSPGGTTIHHSRGCTSACSFCAWWTTMADRRHHEGGRVSLSPRWRTRSPERVMEEVELLYHGYGKRSLVWVDESWNLDPRFNEAFARLLIDSGLKLPWFGFFRADCIVRDERLGILEPLVRSGLAHICVGVERAEDETLERFDKRFYQGGVAEQALRIFKERYPHVFLQGTFIVGVREESRETLARQLELARRLDIDYPAFHPITPVPGTALYEEAVSEGWLEEGDFDDFDWLTPVMDSRYLTRHEIADLLYEMNEIFVNPRWLLRGLASRVPYKRDMYVWFALVAARMALAALRQRVSPFDVQHYQRLVVPPWYGS